MRTSVKVFVGVGVVVICALAAAELLQRSKSRPPVGAVAQPSAPRARVEPDPVAEEPAKVEFATDYAHIGQRDIFRPLVRIPKAAAGGAGDGAPAPGTPKATAPTLGRGPAGGVPRPGDPLADLALTGVVQVGGRLQVLIEKVSTRTGRYVALNEEFEGFRVVLIGESSAVLDRAGKQYTLTMGSKQLPEQAAAAPAGGAASAAPSVASSPPRSSPVRPPGGTMGGGFGGDMLAWAESRSLAELEGMYAQYGAYLSPEDRARAQEYLESRRRRERGQ